MDKPTAVSIVLEINPDSQPLTVDALLEASQGVKNSLPHYRPFIVAAFTLSANPPNSNMAEGGNNAIKFFNWKERITGLLSQQAALDSGIEEIPIDWDVNSAKDNLCDVCDKGGVTPPILAAFAVI